MTSPFNPWDDPCPATVGDTHPAHWSSGPIPLLSQGRDFYDFMAALRPKLTWRGKPVQQPDGTWKEIWEGRPKGSASVLFTIELRPCLGRGVEHTAILHETTNTGTGPGHYASWPVGHFLTLQGAQARARRIYEGR